jgi:hypothetical protein
VLGAGLTDDEGRLMATVSLVSQLIKDLSRLNCSSVPTEEFVTHDVHDEVL